MPFLAWMFTVLPWFVAVRPSTLPEEPVSLITLVKLWRNMVRTFKGTSMGEWVNSTRQLVEFACQQVQRDAAKRTEHETTLDMRPTAKEMGPLAEPWRPWRGVAACLLWTYYRAAKGRSGAPVNPT